MSYSEWETFNIVASLFAPYLLVVWGGTFVRAVLKLNSIVGSILSVLLVALILATIGFLIAGPYLLPGSELMGFEIKLLLAIVNGIFAPITFALGALKLSEKKYL